MVGQQAELFDAIRAGDLERVRALVGEDRGLLNRRNERGNTPVLIAQYHRKREVLGYLLSLDPELDVFDACSVGRSDRVAALLDEDPSLLNAYSSDGFFPLGLAAFFGHPETVRLLLARGADVTVVARNPMKVQALHAGAASRNFDVVQQLLDAGAPVNTGQQEGWTPLHAAAQHGDVKMARALLARGADPKQQNEKGTSAIGIAAERQDTEMLKVLKGSN
jgi:ankyrin repeat protein